LVAQNQVKSGIFTRGKALHDVQQATNNTLLGEQKHQPTANNKFTPEFIAKHLKMSPSKSGSCSPSKSSPSKQTGGRVDLIGSKKSKKNLKRL
jgi:hypothetical protein